MLITLSKMKINCQHIKIAVGVPVGDFLLKAVAHWIAP